MTILLTLLLAGPLQDPPADPAKEFTALCAEYDKAYDEFMRPSREAKTDEERRKIFIDYNNQPARAFTTRFLAFAEKNKTNESGARGYLKAMELAPMVRMTDEAAAACAALLENHLASPLMEDLAARLCSLMYLYADKKLVPFDKACAGLRAIIEKTTHAGAKSSALLSLALNLMMGAGDATAPLDEARTLLATLRKDHPDSSYAKSA